MMLHPGNPHHSANIGPQPQLPLLSVPLLVATARTYVWVSSMGLGRVFGCPQSLQPCMAAHRLPIL